MNVIFDDLNNSGINVKININIFIFLNGELHLFLQVCDIWLFITYERF